MNKGDNQWQAIILRKWSDKKDMPFFLKNVDFHGKKLRRNNLQNFSMH